MSNSEKRKFKLFFATDVIIILILLLWHFVINTHEPGEVALTVPNTNDDSSLNFDLEPKEENKNDERSNASDAPKTSTESNTSDLPAKEDAPSFDPTPSDEPEIVRHSVTLVTNNYGTIKDTTLKTSTVLIDDGKSVDVVGGDLLIGGVAYISALPDNDEYIYSAFIHDSTCGDTVTKDCKITLEFDRSIKYYNVKIGIDNPDYANIDLSILAERVKNYTASVPYGTEVELINDNETIKFFGRGLNFYAQTELMLNTVEYTYESTGIISNTCGTSVTENCSVTFGVNRILNEYVVTFMMEEVGNDVYTSVPKKYGETLNIDEIDAPEKDGYIFLGWIDSDDNAVTGTITVNSNIQYRATWKECHSLSTISSMQEMTPLIVENSLENETKQLIDTRDNKLYWVTKLKDGNIWMTQNLDYDIVAGDNIVSNNDGTTSIWNSSSAYAPTETATQLVAATRSLTGTYSYDNGDKGYINGASTETTGINCNTTSNSGEDCHYHMGNYYQWNAATAGTGGTITGQDAPSSICPKGWRLPIGNSYTADKSFGKLTNAYGITADNNATTDAAFIASPLYFLRGGGIDNRGNIVSLTSPSDLSSYWSSTATDTTDRAYRVYIMKDGLVSPTARYTRDHSFFVRCVANVVETPEEPEPIARTMQSVADWKDELEVEEQIQVTDERDGKKYWVAKLKDGNIWMTQNLDYDIVAGDNIVSNLDGTTSVWNTSSTYAPQTTLTGTDFKNHFNDDPAEKNETYSYDPGDYYWDGTTWLGANSNSEGFSNAFLSAAFSTAASENEGEHYHVGNYYQWNAATAGTGDIITADDAVSSICPKGWRIPTNDIAAEAKYSFNKLVNIYNITTGSALAESPLYYVPTGCIGSTSKLYRAGYIGLYWSSKNQGINYTYSPTFQTGSITSFDYSTRYSGLTVRCVAM